MTKAFLVMATLVVMVTAGDVFPRKDLSYKPPPFQTFDKYSPTYPKLGFPDYNTGRNPFRSYDYAPKKAVVPVKKVYDYDYAPAYGKTYADPYDYQRVVPAAVPVKKVYAPDYDYKPVYPAANDYLRPDYGKDLAYGYKPVVPVKKAYDYDYRPVYPVKKDAGFGTKLSPGFAPVSGLGGFGAKGAFAGAGLGPVGRAFDYTPDYVKPAVPARKGFGFAPEFVKPVVPVKKGFGFAPDFARPVVPVKKGFGFEPDYVKPVVPVKKGFGYTPDYVRPVAFPVKKVVAPAYSDYDYRPSYYDGYRGDAYKPTLLAKEVYPARKVAVPVRAVYPDPYAPAKRVGGYADYVPAVKVGVKPVAVKTPARVFPTNDAFGKRFDSGFKARDFGSPFNKDFLPKFKF